MPIIAPSARTHGIADLDMIHAYDHPRKIYDLDDGLMMFIGPDRAARMIEVGVVEGDLGPVIVHAMKARAKFL